MQKIYGNHSFLDLYSTLFTFSDTRLDYYNHIPIAVMLFSFNFIYVFYNVKIGYSQLLSYTRALFLPDLTLKKYF